MERWAGEGMSREFLGRDVLMRGVVGFVAVI